MRINSLFCTCILVTVATTVIISQDKARAKSPRLVRPSVYRTIPNSVRIKLEKKGCYLPEVQESDGSNGQVNVVSGSFGGKEQYAWAALCVINDRPLLLLFWQGKSNGCPDEIRSGWPLRTKFSEDPASGIALRKATVQKILNYRKAFPEGEKPHITHDGLEVGDEQASLIYYCDSGKWMELRGSD